tara:strand:- start:265 stop:927 length:663 start_codon:yes stop_codon:yes gene_type:complete
MEQKREGLLFVVSAPSGTGKSTLVSGLIQRVPGLVKSRSYTTRPPRPGESNGIDYHFVAKETFQQMIDAEEFLEWTFVFGHFYGTHAAETARYTCKGEDVILVIDVQGAKRLREQCVSAVGVFILPPSFMVLEDRLRMRSEGLVDETQLFERLNTAKEEVSARRDYSYVIVNNELDLCVDTLRCIVIAERARGPAIADVSDAIAETFRDPGRRVMSSSWT